MFLYTGAPLQSTLIQGYKENPFKKKINDDLPMVNRKEILQENSKISKEREFPRKKLYLPVEPRKLENWL